MLKRYEILFFMGPDRSFGGANTFQVEASTMLEALGLLTEEWPEAIAYYAKEGWSDITGHKVMYGGNKTEPNPAKVSNGPLAKRLKAREQKGWNI